MPVITCIDDLKRIYRRRTPRMFYDYAESGSYTESTFRANTDDFQKKIEKLKKEGRKSALLLVANANGELRFVALGLQ